MKEIWYAKVAVFQNVEFQNAAPLGVTCSHVAIQKICYFIKKILCVCIYITSLVNI